MAGAAPLTPLPGQCARLAECSESDLDSAVCAGRRVLVVDPAVLRLGTAAVIAFIVGAPPPTLFGPPCPAAAEGVSIFASWGEACCGSA